MLIVDVQNDFCPGVALGIQAGDRVIEPLNRAAALFGACGLPVVSTRHWHPFVNRHFKDVGGDEQPWRSPQFDRRTGTWRSLAAKAYSEAKTIGRSRVGLAT